MLAVGKTDAFERRYMEKFRMFASQFGEFVQYEHDRGARDIGLHLTHKLKSGQERLSSALCWFQMKGIMASTLSARDFENQDNISISLDLKHLKYWYLQPMPTYLIVYIESADNFLILNIQKYISETWGKEILVLNQKTATVYVSKDSVLDKQAFNLILVKSDIEEWKKALESDESNILLCRRDYNFIWHLGTAQERQVKHHVIFRKWLTKCRGELYILEHPLSVKEDYQILQKHWQYIQSYVGYNKWLTDLQNEPYSLEVPIASETKYKVLREHWQYFMNLGDLEIQYPYLEFFSMKTNETESDSWVDDWEDEDDEFEEIPSLVLPNGDTVAGQPFGDEYIEYYFSVQLNDLGDEMVSWIQYLVNSGLLEVDSGKGESISIAPWHSRAV